MPGKHQGIGYLLWVVAQGKPTQHERLFHHRDAQGSRRISCLAVMVAPNQRHFNFRMLGTPKHQLAEQLRILRGFGMQ